MGAAGFGVGVGALNQRKSAVGIVQVRSCLWGAPQRTAAAIPLLLLSVTSAVPAVCRCEDPRNCVIIADFAVQGTLARDILGNPATVMTRAGIKVSITGLVGGSWRDLVGGCTCWLAGW